MRRCLSCVEVGKTYPYCRYRRDQRSWFRTRRYECQTPRNGSELREAAGRRSGFLMHRISRSDSAWTKFPHVSTSWSRSPRRGRCTIAPGGCKQDGRRHLCLGCGRGGRVDAWRREDEDEGGEFPVAEGAARAVYRGSDGGGGHWGRREGVMECGAWGVGRAPRFVWWAMRRDIFCCCCCCCYCCRVRDCEMRRRSVRRRGRAERRCQQTAGMALSRMTSRSTTIPF